MFNDNLADQSIIARLRREQQHGSDYSETVDGTVNVRTIRNPHGFDTQVRTYQDSFVSQWCTAPKLW
jgi:hypothetical protein